MLFAASAIGLAIVGTILFGINTMRVEGNENKISVWPWLIFALLGLNDFLLIVFSPEPTIFEIFAGLVMFLGPLAITAIILLQNSSKEHLSVSGLDLFFFVLALGSILSMTLIEFLIAEEIISNWGDTLIESYGFMIFVIFLDLISVVILCTEIKSSPKNHEYWSWICFFFASILGTYHQVYIAKVSLESGIVPTIMIAENILVAAIVLPFVLVFQMRDK